MSKQDDMRKAQELELEQRKADDIHVMSTPAGRRFVNRIIASCGVDSAGHIGSAEIHYRAGARDVGIRIKQEMEAVCFDRYIEMLQEARAK